MALEESVGLMSISLERANHTAPTARGSMSFSDRVLGRQLGLRTGTLPTPSWGA